MSRPRWELVVRHLPLARGMAGRRARSHPGDFEEYYDAAVDGLIAASAKFRDGTGEFGRLARCVIAGRLVDRIRASLARKRGAGRRPVRLDGRLDVPAPPGDDGGLAIEELVRGLPGREAEALVLRFRDGLSGPEIAGRTGRHPKAVERAIRSGLDRLARKLGREGRR
jgi:DNA-directed RNA polymerase specialized sigma24 family protein